MFEALAHGTFLYGACLLRSLEGHKTQKDPQHIPIVLITIHPIHVIAFSRTMILLA